MVFSLVLKALNMFMIDFSKLSSVMMVGLSELLILLDLDLALKGGFAV